MRITNLSGGSGTLGDNPKFILTKILGAERKKEEKNPGMIGMNKECLSKFSLTAQQFGAVCRMGG